MKTVTFHGLLVIALTSLLASTGVLAQDKSSSQSTTTMPALAKPPVSPVKPVIKLPPKVILTKPVPRPAETKTAEEEAEGKPAEEPAPVPAAALVLPYRASTSAIEVIGAPKPPAVGLSPDFRPVRLATSAIEVIGNASLPPPPAGPFSPVRVRTDAIEVIGTTSGE